MNPSSESHGSHGSQDPALLQSLLKSADKFNSLFERFVIVQEKLTGTNQNPNLPYYMTPEIVQALIDALNSLTELIKTDSANVAAAQAAAQKAQSDLAALQATDAALQDPALVTAAQAAIDAAHAAQPPVVAPAKA